MNDFDPNNHSIAEHVRSRIEAKGIVCSEVVEAGPVSFFRLNVWEDARTRIVFYGKTGTTMVVFGNIVSPNGFLKVRNNEEFEYANPDFPQNLLDYLDKTCTSSDK